MTENRFTQREKRFDVENLKEFEAIVRRGESDDTVFFAEVLDFSRSGVKFQVPFSARFDEKIYIRLTFKNSELAYEGVGRVRHIRSTDVNRWIVGCSIDPMIPDELISFLASVTQQERRRNPRLDINALGMLSRQGDYEEEPAEIQNISKGGFCVLVEKPHEPGACVNLAIENRLGYREKIAGRVRWRKEHEEGYLVGLSYADSESYEKLVECLDLIHNNGNVLNGFSWKMAVVATMALLLPSLSYLLLGAGLDGENKNSTKPAMTELEPQPVVNPFAIEQSETDQDSQNVENQRPQFEDSQIASSFDNELQENMLSRGNIETNGQPPAELTSQPKAKPRRLRVRQTSDEPDVGTHVASTNAVKSKAIKIDHHEYQDQATTRRRSKARELRIPSETIRKRLMH